MSKFKKKLLGFLTAWPFAYVFLFIFGMIGLMTLQPGELKGIAAFGFLFVLLVHLLTIFLILGLQIFYIIDVFKNERIKQEHRVVWVLALFFGGILAMPIYWYMNIWREVPEEGYYGSITSGENFNPAHNAEWETRTGDPVPPEPHSWR